MDRLQKTPTLDALQVALSELNRADLGEIEVFMQEGSTGVQDFMASCGDGCGNGSCGAAASEYV